MELRSTITDTVFVDCESLHEKFVCRFFEATLIGDLAAGDEETEAKLRCAGIDTCVELEESLVEEAIECGRLSGPIVFKMFSRLVFAS